MTLNKDQVVNSVHAQLGFPINKSFELVESVLEIIKNTLENGEDVLISGFGKFYIRDKKKRRGKNPQTGRGLMLDARRVVVSVLRG
jgi:integration host factor subunit alpha